MKKAAYQTILAEFEQWGQQYARVCSMGCSACCTENVTITALEGERILAFVIDRGMEQWLVERLRQPPHVARPRLTTNEFAHACINQRETDPGANESLAACPLLEDEVCRIYPVRPFACRCFISTVRCSAIRPAQVDEHYLAASTAMLQLIEHLGQKEYWGNMVDVLLALLDISAYHPIAEALADPSRIMQGRLRTMTARPLPGFLFTETEEERLRPLLQAIFATRIGNVTAEDILNGKTKASFSE